MMALLPDFARLIVVGLLLFIPLFLIYRKAGFSPFWAFLVFVPLGLLVIIAQLAYMPWPNRKQKGEAM